MSRGSGERWKGERASEGEERRGEERGGEGREKTKERKRVEPMLNRRQWRDDHDLCVGAAHSIGTTIDRCGDRKPGTGEQEARTDEGECGRVLGNADR